MAFKSLETFDRLEKEFRHTYNLIKKEKPGITDDDVRRDSRMVAIGEDLERLRRRHWHACAGKIMRKKS